MIKYSVMDAWMMYIVPMAPAALLNTHSLGFGVYDSGATAFVDRLAVRSGVDENEF